MSAINSRTIRIRLLLLTVLTITPVILLIIYLNIVQLEREYELEKDKLVTASQIASTEHLQIIEGARQLLISLSISPQILTPSSDCSTFLREVLNKYQRYNNLALADTNGNVICNAAATPIQEPVNISDRYFFKNIKEFKEFTIGEYSVSKTTNQPVLSFGYPVLDTQNNLQGIIYSSLDLGWLKNLVSNLSLGENAVLIVLDRNGDILASNQTSYKTESLLPSAILVNNLHPGSDLVEDNSMPEDYLYAYSQIGKTDSSPYAVIGIPKSKVFQKPNQDFAQAVVISLIIGLFSIIGGWFVGNSLITGMLIAIGRVEELKRDFVSLVSHQLRTPLTAIKYFSEILLSGSPGKLNFKQKEFLSDISSSTNRLVFLVGTLLDIARLESGKINLALEKVALKTLFDEAASELAQLSRKKKLKIQVRFAKNVRFALIDPKLIKQVMINLMANAIKYSNMGTTIEINASQNKNGAIVVVKNQGIEILPEDKPHIFLKFFRTEPARRADSEGSGLGLYLSRLIIEAHDGKMWFESNKKTTCFFFTLPLR